MIITYSGVYLTPIVSFGISPRELAVLYAVCTPYQLIGILECYTVVISEMTTTKFLSLSFLSLPPPPTSLLLQHPAGESVR